MSWTFAAYSLDVVGKILIGVAVLLVHRGMMKERKVDLYVIKEIKYEELLTIIGILFIISGYVIHALNY